MEINEINHMDIANQIDNSWQKDTILALANKLKKLYYSIRLKNSDKSKIKKKFIQLNDTQSAKRHNKRVINLIFAYIIWKILEIKKDKISDVLICPDHRPTKEVHHYIQKISSFYGNPNLTSQIKIKFINRKEDDIRRRTPANNFARKVLRGKLKANFIVDITKLETVISKLL